VNGSTCRGPGYRWTNAKTVAVSSDGALAAPVVRTTVNSNGTADEILGAFASALKTGLTDGEPRGLTISGVGVSICGPFDYEEGISKIASLDKYESIYDMNVKQSMRGEPFWMRTCRSSLTSDERSLPPARDLAPGAEGTAV